MYSIWKILTTGIWIHCSLPFSQDIGLSLFWLPWWGYTRMYMRGSLSFNFLQYTQSLLINCLIQLLFEVTLVLEKIYDQCSQLWSLQHLIETWSPLYSLLVVLGLTCCKQAHIGEYTSKTMCWQKQMILHCVPASPPINVNTNINPILVHYRSAGEHSKWQGVVTMQTKVKVSDWLVLSVLSQLSQCC